MTPVADFVIASYRKDLPWLRYNLEFLVKHWLEPESKFIVRLDEDCRDIIEQWAPNPRIIYFYQKPWPDGYHFQMYLKMTADMYSDADILILLDSDVMLMQPAGLDDLMEDGKPVIYYLDWSESAPHSEAKWRAGTTALMGMDLDRDYLCTTPFTFWRSTLAEVRSRIEEVQRRPFRECVYSERPYNYVDFLNHPMIYSDFHALNLYAAKCEPDRYVVKHRPERNWPFVLFWSHGWNPLIERQLQDALAR